MNGYDQTSMSSYAYYDKTTQINTVLNRISMTHARLAHRKFYCV